jgi:CrcB protein
MPWTFSGAAAAAAALPRVLLIATGGAVGTLFRYGTSLALLRVTERLRFPIGTLTVNVAGCFLIGYLQAAFAARWIGREDLRLALVVGFLGGLTTFSSYGWESATLLRDGLPGRAVLTITASNVIGIVMVMAGYALGRR